MVDQGEGAEAAARREVSEETGCEVQELELIGEYMTSPGITDEYVSLFVARVDAARAGGVHGLASEAEDIRTFVLTAEDGVAASKDGRVRNAMSQIALLWFALNGKDLRQRWS